MQRYSAPSRRKRIPSTRHRPKRAFIPNWVKVTSREDRRVSRRAGETGVWTWSGRERADSWLTSEVDGDGHCAGRGRLELVGHMVLAGSRTGAALVVRMGPGEESLAQGAPPEPGQKRPAEQRTPGPLPSSPVNALPSWRRQGALKQRAELHVNETPGPTVNQRVRRTGQVGGTSWTTQRLRLSAVPWAESRVNATDTAGGWPEPAWPGP